MSNEVDQHPAVKTPKKALGNTNKVKKKVAPQARSATNQTNAVNVEMLSDIDLFNHIHSNRFKNVTISPYNSNTNLIVKCFNYGAWTQSDKLIYMRTNIPDFLRPLVLFHEGFHVDQFRKSGSHPKRAESMLNFEVQTYLKTWEWMKRKNTKDVYFSLSLVNEYDDAVQEAKETFDGVFATSLISIGNNLGSVARRIGYFLKKTMNPSNPLKAPTNMSFEDIVISNMIDSELLPPYPPNASIKYSINDMYLPNQNKQFFNDRGFKDCSEL